MTWAALSGRFLFKLEAELLFDMLVLVRALELAPVGPTFLRISDLGGGVRVAADDDTGLGATGAGVEGFPVSMDERTELRNCEIAVRNMSKRVEA